MRYCLVQAAEATGRSRSTILRSIKAGRLSADRDALTQAWMIDAAELLRLYPLLSDDEPRIPADGQPRTSELTELRTRLEAADLRFADAQDQIADLRRRLDTATEQLGEALQQVRLLTDQRQAVPAPKPARRSWRLWRRG
jgi:hypothetical protein